jgi:hypothetical protein
MMMFIIGPAPDNEYVRALGKTKVEKFACAQAQEGSGCVCDYRVSGSDSKWNTAANTAAKEPVLQFRRGMAHCRGPLIFNCVISR